MAKHIEKRRCRRFFIPGATMTFCRKRWFRYSKRTENHAPVGDMSKGGLSFFCETPLRKGDRLVIRLEIPGEKALDLLGKVVWHSRFIYSLFNTGVKFMPFTDEKGTNPTWALSALEQMDRKYGCDEKMVEGLSKSGKEKPKISLDEIIF